MEPVFDPYERTTIRPVVAPGPLAPEPTHAWPGGDVIRNVYESDVPLAVGAVPAIPLAPSPIDSRPLWPFVAAAVALALILGGIGGYLIGNARNDHTTATPAPTSQAIVTAIPEVTAAPVASAGSAPSIAPATAAPTAADDAAVVNKTLDSLLTQTQSAGALPSPSPYPQLDQIVAIQTAKNTATLQDQIATLTASQTQASEQATTMQAQLAAAQASLADAQKQRDDLTAQLAQSTGSTADLQKQMADRDQQISTLQTAAATAKSSLDTANAALAKANTDLDTAKNQLATANATLAKLNPKALTSFVNGDVAKARSQASANGWTIIEKSADNPSAAAGTVTAQTPAAGTTMVSGSVLYVEVAAKAGG